MTQILSVIQQKGGAGKTTLAVHLAFELARTRQLRVVVADADPQRSATKWIARGDDSITATSVAEDGEGRALKRELDSIDADVVIVDLPPAIGSVSLRAALYSDLMLVPVGPSVLDIEAAHEAVSVCKEAVDLDPRKAFLLVPTRIRSSTAAGREVREALARWGPLSQASLGLRQAFADAAAAGQGVGTFAPNSAAHKEITSLLTEITSHLRGTDEQEAHIAC